MTDPMMHVRSLVENTPDAYILRDMISFAAELLMEMEVGNLTGAAMAAKAGANQAFYERQLSLLSDQVRTDRNRPSLTRSRKPISNLSNVNRRRSRALPPRVASI